MILVGSDMVPDRFNMVDMGGIDIVMAQGERVSGLWQRLVESITLCRYQCLYNWKFDGVDIPPTYVEMEVNENDEVAINQGITVDDEDVVHIYSIMPPSPEPTITPLIVNENGNYFVPSGIDGFNPVTVDVPTYTPVIEPITITENGVYTLPSGVDGYGPITVNVISGHPFSVAVNGGYNGGAVVTVTDGLTSEQLIRGVGSTPYNLQYTPNYISTTIGNHEVEVSIPNLASNTSELVVTITFDGLSKSVSFYYTGANTSYGYGSQSQELRFY